jgi:hypothetical protein
MECRLLLEGRTGADVGDGVLVGAGDEEQRAARLVAGSDYRLRVTEKLAAAASNSGRAGEGITHLSNSSAESPSGSAKPNPNCVAWPRPGDPGRGRQRHPGRPKHGQGWRLT